MPLGSNYQTLPPPFNRQPADEDHFRKRRDEALQRGHIELAEAYHKAMWAVTIRQEVGHG
jgi:hypothetical protein